MLLNIIFVRILDHISVTADFGNALVNLKMLIFRQFTALTTRLLELATDALLQQGATIVFKYTARAQAVCQINPCSLWTVSLPQPMVMSIASAGTLGTVLSSVQLETMGQFGYGNMNCHHQLPKKIAAVSLTSAVIDCCFVNITEPQQRRTLFW